MLNGQIGLLDQAVVEAAQENEKAKLLMTQPGVGPLTSMAFVLTMGDAGRFQRGKQVASYLGLIPRGSTVRADISGWDRSANQETASCECCWSKPRKARCAAIRDFGTSICIAATRSRKEWPKVAAAKRVGSATLLDAAHPYRVSRSRSCREQLAGAAGQRKLDRSQPYKRKGKTQEWAEARRRHKGGKSGREASAAKAALILRHRHG